MAQLDIRSFLLNQRNTPLLPDRRIVIPAPSNGNTTPVPKPPDRDITRAEKRALLAFLRRLPPELRHEIYSYTLTAQNSVKIVSAERGLLSHFPYVFQEGFPLSYHELKPLNKKPRIRPARPARPPLEDEVSRNSDDDEDDEEEEREESESESEDEFYGNDYHQDEDADGEPVAERRMCSDPKLDA